MDATSPTARLRAWLQEALGVMRDAVAEPAAATPRAFAPAATPPAPQLADAFSARALVGDGGLIAGWGPTRARLDDAVDAFVGGQPVAIAIVGEGGSGREVLLDHVERKVRRADGGTRAARVDAPRSGLRDALRSALGDASAQRRALLLAAAHRAYRRRIGGFDALRAGLDLLSDTVGQVLWVVEFDAVPWSYLDRVYQVAAHFTHVVEVPALGVEDLHLALQRRLVALAGAARFEFVVPPELPLEEHANWARSGYPQRLHLASRGNPEAAGALVLRQLREGGGDGAYRVEAPPLLPLSDLGVLPPQHVVALELLLGHTALTPAELAELLVLAPSEARALLDGLGQHGLVSGDRHRGYAVDPVWRAPLTDLLRSKNLL
ncbi:MAG: hypothetical protein KDD82_07365 [Planctomycetes bacterium]|nr:hypothetical protein [Planctomycetota bacterium]